MIIIARIIGLSLLAAGFGAFLGHAFFGHHSDWVGVSLLLACVGGVIGAVSRAARGIVAAPRPRPSSLARAGPPLSWPLKWGPRSTEPNPPFFVATPVGHC